MQRSPINFILSSLPRMKNNQLIRVLHLKVDQALKDLQNKAGNVPRLGKKQEQHKAYKLVKKVEYYDQNLSSFLSLYKQFYLISAQRRMPGNKQQKNSLSSMESYEQKQQMVLFYKSYLKYIKKLIENSSSENSENTIFDLKKLSGNISLELFLQRVLSYFKCGAEAFICSLCFIDRLLNSQSAKTENITLSIKNVYKIISVALLLSTKNFNDFYYNNTYYSRVCGLTLQQLNLLEKQFLQMIDYDVFIDAEQYSSYESVILSYKKFYSDEMKHLIEKENLLSKENRKDIKPRGNNFQDRTNYDPSKEESSTNIQVEIVA